MGSWGPGIFANDGAADARISFRELIGGGYSVDEATEHLLSEFGDDPDVWLGLAVLQWKSGWLLESVKTRALQIIDSGEDLERWSDSDPKVVKARVKELEKTRILLESPQPPAKLLPKRRRFKETNDWEVGELVSHRRPSGKHLVFRVYGHHDGGIDYRRAIVELLDYYDEAPPSLDQARKLSRRVLVGEHRQYAPYWNWMMYADSKRQLPKKDWVRLGMCESPRDLKPDLKAQQNIGWEWVDEVNGDNIIRWDLVETIERLLPFTCQPGPGGDEHRQWQLGDVLAYQGPSGQYLLLHLVDRLQGDTFDGAPIVAILDWEKTTLPNADEINSGALEPLQYWWAPIYYVNVLVHSDDDAVNPSEVRRIGSFPVKYDVTKTPTRHGLPLFAPIAGMTGQFERKRAQESTLRPPGGEPP